MKYHLNLLKYLLKMRKKYGHNSKKIKKSNKSLVFAFNEDFI